jgi:small-conductance mechanosensitive channel
MRWRRRCSSWLESAIESVARSMRVGSPLYTAAAIGAAVLVLWILVSVAKRLLHEHALRLVARSRTSLDDLVVHLLHRTQLPAVLFVVLWFAPLIIDTPPGWHTALRSGAIIALTLQLALWVNAAARFMTDRFVRHGDVRATAATAVSALSFGVQLLMFSLLVLLALANLGVNVSTLLAGLGVGGVAVALAIQNVLKDLLGALNIVISKPFLVGDLIEIDEYLGEVKIVGMRATTLINLPGEEIHVPNQKLLEGVVRNHSRMLERRVSTLLSVHHTTPAAALAAVPTIVAAAVGESKLTRFERASLKRAVTGAFEFEIVYCVESADYDVYARVNHDVWMSIVGGLETRRISIAIPAAAQLTAAAPGPFSE